MVDGREVNVRIAVNYHSTWCLYECDETRGWDRDRTLKAESSAIVVERWKGYGVYR